MTTRIQQSPSRPAEPTVSIIMLNWNQFDVTAACLDTLVDLTWPSVEVLVVDQASDNQEGDRLKARYPWIRLIQSETNLGFTGGNNLAIRQAEGDLVLLLNNDTEVGPSFLEPLVQVFVDNPMVGIASPKIRYFDAPDHIQYAGCDGINEWTMRGSTRGHGEVDNGQHDRPLEVALAHGAAMMIRRKVLETTGLLAEDFFIYYEEFDLSTRARRDGWSIRYVPSSLVMHKESITVGKDSPFKTQFMTRNRITYLRRNLLGGKRLIALAYVLGVALPVGLARHALRGQFAHVRSMLKGAYWHLAPRRVHDNETLVPRTINANAVEVSR